jgi:hypothetical protein
LLTQPIQSTETVRPNGNIIQITPRGGVLALLPLFNPGYTERCALVKKMMGSPPTFLILLDEGGSHLPWKHSQQGLFKTKPGIISLLSNAKKSVFR